jgi:hypothetical protein
MASPTLRAFVPLPDLREYLESAGEDEFVRSILANRAVLLCKTPEEIDSDDTVSTEDVFEDSKSSADPSSWYQNTAAILRTRHSAAPAEVRVGRNAKCDLILVVPTVSQDHAILRETADGWTVTDLDSKNGTYVNEEKVAANTTIRLAEGDVVRFGRYLPLTLVSPPALLRMIDPGA